MKLTKILKATLVALFAFSAFPIVAAAQPSISVPVTTIVTSNQVGSRHVLATEPVESKYQGMVCSVTAVSINQDSEHPNSDLVVSSVDSVVLKDVENKAYDSVTAEGQLTLGENLVVTLIMGDDKVFSGGINVNLDCKEKPQDIEVCRDGKVITIKEDEKLETDTDLPCPEEGEIQVCRDGDVINIKESERLESDTDAPCPQVIGVATTLPKTGAGSIAFVAGSGILGTIAHSVVTRKRLQ